MEIEEYLRLRERPAQRMVMRQRWRSLLFLHFAVEPAVVQATLPPGLTVDTFGGKAWIGLVPFRMEGVRPVGLPAFRPLSDFPETNVRTYVHREGRDPGVWFYSLDAAQATACRIARRFFGLPYHFASMQVGEGASAVRYRSRRERGGAGCEVAATLGATLGPAEPGSLEFFLVERYLLYSERNGKLATGRVHHAPYSLRQVPDWTVSENLVEAAGLPPTPFFHGLYSEGVDVEVFALQR